MDDRSGDFIEHSGPLNINLRTLFHFRKPYPPRIDPCSLKRAIAPQPLPVNYTTMNWLWGGILTGAQLDTLSKSTRPVLANNQSLARLDRLCRKHLLPQNSH